MMKWHEKHLVKLNAGNLVVIFGTTILIQVPYHPSQVPAAHLQIGHQQMKSTGILSSNDPQLLYRNDRVQVG